MFIDEQTCTWSGEKEVEFLIHQVVFAWQPKKFMNRGQENEKKMGFCVWGVVWEETDTVSHASLGSSFVDVKHLED